MQRAKPTWICSCMAAHSICKICKKYAKIYALYANHGINMQNMHGALCWCQADSQLTAWSPEIRRAIAIMITVKVQWRGQKGTLRQLSSLSIYLDSPPAGGPRASEPPGWVTSLRHAWSGRAGPCSAPVANLGLSLSRDSQIMMITDQLEMTVHLEPLVMLNSLHGCYIASTLL